MKEPAKGYKRYFLSLTGDNSHIIDLLLGQGSLSIGTKGVSEGDYDVWVEAGEKINWDAFNELYTDYGSRRKDEYPYGNWPRFIKYSGTDTGFIAWTSKRITEDFHWIPTEDVCADMENVMIYRLHLTLEHKVNITAGQSISWMLLYGDPTNLDIKTNGGDYILKFNMTGYTSAEKTYRIPEFRDLFNSETVDVEVSPLGDAFDCESLIQFTNLKKLQITGNICNAGALAEFKNLESLRLYSVPDLTDLPPVSCWENLERFIGVDIDEKAGKDIRKQLKALGKDRKIDVHISKLRSRTWFETEYDNPFKHWEGKQGKKASGLYKDMLKEIAKAEDENMIRECIIRFTEAFNEFDDIETEEREDIWDAVNRLAKASTSNISKDTLMHWFDEARDY